MRCSHCGKELDNDKLSFCVYCGYPLKGSKQGFFAKSEKTGTSRADELVRSESPSREPAPKREKPAPQAAPAQQQAAPVQAAAPVAPQPVMQQQMAQPVMNAMPQMGVAGMPVPPHMAAQGVPPVPPVQGGVMPNMPQMGMPQMMGAVQQPVQPVQNPEMGSMPAYGMPQMAYGMPQMYGMPQFAGYDAAGNPIYMQMIPQFMGYDTYGNPLYNMVAMPIMMPNMQGVNPVPPVQPVMQQMYPQPEAVIELQQEQVQMSEAAPVLQSVPAEQQPDPEEHQAVIVSSDDIPINADSLIDDEEQAKPDVPDEKAILDRIFSDAPKNYSMSEGTAPSGAVFSISIGANEITSIRDEEAPAPTAPKPVKKAAAAEAAPAPKAEKKTAKTDKTDKTASKKKPAQKKPATIVSPDDFFNDKPRTPRGTINVAELDNMDDEQLAAHLARQQATAGKLSTRSMKAASRDEMDISNIDVDSVLAGKNQFPQ